MSDIKYTRQTVLSIKEWLPGKLLSLSTTRDENFEFKAGQFARLGLQEGNDPNIEPTVWRAYSMVNGPSAPTLEFYSIVVPDGQFSPKLATLGVGDSIYIDKTAFGFLTIERFEPGGTLWLLATGTGLSAYLSLLHDDNTWTSFERIILVHGVRTISELTYREQIDSWLSRRPLSGASRWAKLSYLPLPTQEALQDFPQARLTTLLQSGELEHLAGCPLDPATSKVMLCGNPHMLTDARTLLKDKGFAVGRRGIPGNLAVENYW